MSQRGNVESMAELTGLTHDIFINGVVDIVRRSSPACEMMKDASPGDDYQLVGQSMRFALDTRFKTGGIATSGNIPDYQQMDAVKGKLVPVRRYVRLARDHFTEARARGEGAHEDQAGRIFDHLWSAWNSMEIRHSIGYSHGLVCKALSRSTSTVWVAKDGYGNAGTNPIQHFAENSVLSWYDVSASGVGGAGKVASMVYSTNTVTMDSASTWEPSATLEADDLIYFATTNDSTSAHFEQERDLAPNGFGNFMDPNADYTTMFDISETLHPRTKPFRQTAVTADHLEFTEHWQKLGSKRGFPVTPATDTVLTFPGVVAHVARSLLGFQQQGNLGGQLKGGYTSLTVAGIPFKEDPFFFHDAAFTVCHEKVYRIPLGKDADFWAEDGSMWSRMADYDGSDAYVVDYLNQFTPDRGSHGALVGIVADTTASEYDNVPNY